MAAAFWQTLRSCCSHVLPNPVKQDKLKNCMNTCFLYTTFVSIWMFVQLISISIIVFWQCSSCSTHCHLHGSGTSNSMFSLTWTLDFLLHINSTWQLHVLLYQKYNTILDCWIWIFHLHHSFKWFKTQLWKVKKH